MSVPRICTGDSPSGKASAFGADIRGFESLIPSQENESPSGLSFSWPCCVGDPSDLRTKRHVAIFSLNPVRPAYDFHTIYAKINKITKNYTFY